MDQFLHGPLPGGFSITFIPSLYTTESHRKLQSISGWHSFYMFDNDLKKAEAALHVHVEDGKGHSPYRAPYGSFDWNKSIDQSRMKQFVDFIEVELKLLSLKSITLRNQDYLVTEKDELENVLMEKGYRIERQDMGACLLVTPNFEGKLEAEKRRRLRHQKEMLHSRSRSLEELPSIYNFIKDCRTQKGYELSMTLPEVEALAKTFPDKAFLFETVSEEKRMAAAICILEREDVLYVFYYDQQAEYNQVTPVVSLMEAINKHCLNYSIDRINLGTSMLGDRVNKGLLDFKLSMGALPTFRNTWQKQLL